MLDPQAKALIDLMIEKGIPPVHTLTATQAREAYVQRRFFSQPEAPEVASSVDTDIPGPASKITVRG